MDQSKRILLLGSLAGLGTLLCGSGINAQDMAVPKSRKKERVIKLQAKKFEYTPNQIIIKKDEHVVLEITSVDFIHGFNIPDFKIRADLPPGKITRIRLNPDKLGRYAFLCDNFCGSGHEEMNGTIIVKA
ncbi:MAG TPA: cupredoxin domain-containing protein [Burkholderiaceae bacterium]|jgi:cytochrome c oxidase subunit 2